MFDAFDFNYHGNVENALKVLHITELNLDEVTSAHIKSAYKARAMLYHPDKNPTEKAAFKFNRLQEARRAALKVIEMFKIQSFDQIGKSDEAYEQPQSKKESLEAFKLQDEVDNDKIQKIYEGFIDEPRVDIEIPKEGDEEVELVRLEPKKAVALQHKKPLFLDTDVVSQGTLPWLSAPGAALDNTMDVSHVKLNEKDEWKSDDPFAMADLHLGIEDVNYYTFDDIFANQDQSLLK